MSLLMRIASSQIHCMKYFTNLSWIVLKLRPFPTDSVWNKEKGAVSPDILTGRELERIITKDKYQKLPRCSYA